MVLKEGHFLFTLWRNSKIGHLKEAIFFLNLLLCYFVFIVFLSARHPAGVVPPNEKRLVCQRCSLKTVIPVTPPCVRSLMFCFITSSFLQTRPCVGPGWPCLQYLESSVRGIGYTVAILSFPSGCPETTRVTKIDFS